MAEVVRISALEASERLNDGWIYVDVRTPSEFERGHPSGSLNVPFLLAASDGLVPNAEFMPVMRAVFGENAKLILSCRSGNRSLLAARRLLQEGFNQISEQRAGWDGARDARGNITEPGWSRLGLPSESGEPAGRTWHELRSKCDAT